MGRRRGGSLTGSADIDTLMSLDWMITAGFLVFLTKFPANCAYRGQSTHGMRCRGQSYTRG